MASPQAAFPDWVLRDGASLRGPFDRLGAGLSDGNVPVIDFCVSRHPCSDPAVIEDESGN